MSASISTSGTSSGIRIDAELSVNDVLARWPAAIGPLNAFGVDTCCGGAASLREAADAAGVPVTALVAAVERALAPEGAR